MSVKELESKLQTELQHALVGMDDVIRILVVALVVKGHVLLEGYPGLGKTLLARSVAKVLGRAFGRVQCTADMMPSDLTGLHVFNEQTKQFELVKGPLFSEFVLVDEINRTGPKTQSAMLEAMEERRITIDRETYDLSKEFFVIATQNPHEFEGTYPLPESQIDRFLLKVNLDYLSRKQEIEVLKTYDLASYHYEDKLADIGVVDPQLIINARNEADRVQVSDAIYEYVTKISETTRHHPKVALGISTRGVLALMRCSRVIAALHGSEFVTPDHVKMIAPYVISHRLVLSQDALFEGVDAEQVTQELLEQVEIPRS